jgi:hypothetical protein
MNKLPKENTLKRHPLTILSCVMVHLLFFLFNPAFSAGADDSI